MGTLQQDCEAIGAKLRETEQAIADGRPRDAIRSVTQLHAALAQGFADHIRPANPDLDWSRIAGTSGTAARDDATAASGTKHEPQPQ